MSVWRMVVLAGLAAAGLHSSPAEAYGRDGHRIVCELAYSLMTEAARAEVDRLMAADRIYETFPESCSWADIVRGTIIRESAPWHYTNQPRDDRTIDEGDCAEDGCIISAINMHAEQFANRSNDAETRLQGLKFLAHWIGDIHQPLHVSIEGNRGGNDIPVLWRGERHTNLHRVWDSEIILDYMSETWPWVPERERWRYFMEELAADIPLAHSTVYTDVDPIAWAQESHDIVRSRDFAYFWATEENMIEPGDAYYERGLRISRQRLQLAAVRLAGVLNTLTAPAEGGSMTGPALD